MLLCMYTVVYYYIISFIVYVDIMALHRLVYIVCMCKIVVSQLRAITFVITSKCVVAIYM